MAADPATAPELATTKGAELVAGGFRMGMLTIAVLGRCSSPGRTRRG